MYRTVLLLLFFVFSGEVLAGDAFQAPLAKYPVNDGCFGWKAKSGSTFHLADDACVNDDNKSVYAVADGVVKFAGQYKPCTNNHNWGYLIIVEHTLSDGSVVNSIYGHAGPVDGISAGSLVNRGDHIGEVIHMSCWLDHIHFGIYVGPYSDIKCSYDVNSGQGSCDAHGYLASTGNYVDPVKFVFEHSIGYTSTGPSSHKDAFQQAYFDLGLDNVPYYAYSYVHDWVGTKVQDVCLENVGIGNTCPSGKDAILMRNPNSSSVFLLKQGFWGLWKTFGATLEQAGQAWQDIGYPSGSETQNGDNVSQSFVHGSMEWKSDKSSIVATVGGMQYTFCWQSDAFGLVSNGTNCSQPGSGQLSIMVMFTPLEDVTDLSCSCGDNPHRDLRLVLHEPSQGTFYGINNEGGDYFFYKTERINDANVAVAMLSETAEEINYHDYDNWFADVNGDGLIDLISYDYFYRYVSVRVGAADGSFAAGTLWLDLASVDAVVGGSVYYTPLVGDFNGDGQWELTYYDPPRGDWYVALSNGTSFGTPQLWRDAFGEEISGNTYDPFIGDINGDGKSDIAKYHQQSHTWAFAFSNGSSFVPQWGVLEFWAHQHTLVDINGDGRDDIVATVDDGRQLVARSNGDSTFTTGSRSEYTYIENFGTQEYANQFGIFYTDVNDDGKDDIVAYYRTQGSWWVALCGSTSCTDDYNYLWEFGEEVNNHHYEVITPYRNPPIRVTPW